MPERHDSARVIRPAAGTRPLGMTRTARRFIAYVVPGRPRPPEGVPVREYRGTGHDMTGDPCYCGTANCPAARKDNRA